MHGMLLLQDIVDSFFWAGNSFISTIVSGVGAANASQAKENCEEDRFVPQSVCDEYQPVVDSGGAAAVSVCVLLYFHLHSAIHAFCSFFPLQHAWCLWCWPST